MLKSTVASITLLDSDSNADAMACVDVKLFHSCIGTALTVFTHSYGCEYCHGSLLLRRGDAIREFTFGAELWFLNIYIIFV